MSGCSIIQNYNIYKILNLTELKLLLFKFSKLTHLWYQSGLGLNQWFPACKLGTNPGSLWEALIDLQVKSLYISLGKFRSHFIFDLYSLYITHNSINFIHNFMNISYDSYNITHDSIIVNYFSITDIRTWGYWWASKWKACGTHWASSGPTSSLTLWARSSSWPWCLRRK